MSFVSARSLEVGTSPRAWGKLLITKNVIVIGRNIPTGVGKTRFAFLRPRKSTEHPHGRGENPIIVMSVYVRQGTSPRAWGKPCKIIMPFTATRNIPTGVGKTSRYFSISKVPTEHPHGRGENVASSILPARQKGTSPRAWGKPKPRPSFALLVRNIPTGVGKTPLRLEICLLCAEHPHGRGENTRITTDSEGRRGTSPRAWGKHPKSLHEDLVGRNIPTGVGKTGATSPFGRSTPEHPHGRGENSSMTLRNRRIAGTSPRAWGKPPDDEAVIRRYRNIPTGVGKTETQCCQ